jgi:uncharacterized protein YndB with AHSA1/START domain
MKQTEFIYMIYIRATPEKVFNALHNPEFTKQYWFHDNVSDWKVGSKWEHVSLQGETRLVGKVLENNPPKKLVVTWAAPSNPEEQSKVTYELEPVEDMTRLTVSHTELVAGSEMAKGISKGWPIVLSSLKSFLETGKPLNVFATKTRKN